jgi:branched-chain amino acid transport system permease protein
MLLVIMQVAANIVTSASLYWLVTVSFVLVYRIGKFFDLTPAIAYTVGAYVTLLAVNAMNLPAYLAVPAGILAAVFTGACLYRFIFASPSLMSTSSSQKFLISLGLVVAVEGTVALLFGDDTRMLGRSEGSVIQVAGAHLSRVQMWTVVCAVGVGLTLIAAENLTRAGQCYRATASDANLSIVVGIPVTRVWILSSGASSAIAGLAGILGGADVGLTPGMGFQAILMGMVAAIVGGVSGFGGAIVGAFLLGAIQNLTALWFGTVWQDAIVFLTLMAFLLLRPQGLLRRASGRVTV